jgi:hypothetical protein
MPASMLPVLWPALYSALNVAAITQTLGCAVYDHLPQPPPAGPYLVLQSPTEGPNRTMGTLGSNTTFQIHIFTSSDHYEGSGLAQRILSAAVGLLEGATLTLSGFSLDGVLYENGFEAGVEDVNGVTYRHYVGMFRAIAGDA